MGLLTSDQIRLINVLVSTCSIENRLAGELQYKCLIKVTDHGVRLAGVVHLWLLQLHHSNHPGPATVL